MTKCINNKCNKLSSENKLSVHESTVIIFYNNDMLWCTNNTHIIMSALFSASPTLQKCTTRKKAQDSQCGVSVLGQWDPSFFRGCGKLIQLHLSKPALEQVSAHLYVNMVIHQKLLPRTKKRGVFYLSLKICSLNRLASYDEYPPDAAASAKII